MDTFPSPSIVDVVALALVAFAALRGFFRGLSGELAGLIGDAAALLLGAMCYEPLAGWMRMHTRVAPALAPVVALVVLVVGVLLLMALLRLTVGRVLRVVVEGGVNRVGGVIAGVLRGLIVVVLVFAVLLVVPNEGVHRRFGEESVVGTVVQRVMPRLRELAGPIEESVLPADMP
ncbi:MAG: CvpA family protein [Verrucomicrobia bacterium]|nr:CvpA family protein [Verrucomicrobiota bacterium]